MLSVMMSTEYSHWFSPQHGKFLSDVDGNDVVLFSSIRELAYQIADQFRVFGKPLGLKDCVITGGMGK